MATVSKLFEAHVMVKARMKKVRTGEIPGSPAIRLRLLQESMRICRILQGCEVEIVLPREDEELVARLVSDAEPPEPADQPA